jgi:thioredoxin 1
VLGCIEEEDFQQEVVDRDGVTVVDFYADWCGPCRVLGPILEDISEEKPEVKFVKMNVDKNQKIVESFGIRNVPTIIIFHNGRIITKNVGSATKFEIENMIDDAVRTASS